MSNPLTTLAGIGAMLAFEVPARACPFCASDTGRQIHAGIFDASFGPTLLLVLSPFPVLLGIVLALHLLVARAVR